MSLLITAPSQLGDTPLEGQVVLLDLDAVNFSAPTARKPWFKFTITATMAVNGAPDAKSIDWLWKPGVKLLALLVLPDGTLDLADIDSQGEEPSA